MTTYREAVAEARRLIKRSEEDQWRLAELTYNRAQPQRGREVLPSGKVSLSRWAEDIRVSEATARRLYGIWDRFGSPSATGQRPSYSEAFQAVDKGLDVENVYAERHQMEARRTVRNMPPERKAAIARELLNEPEVAARIEDDLTEHVASSPRRTAKVVERATEKRPAPSRPERDPNALDYMAALGVGSTAVMDARRLADRVSTLMAVLRNGTNLDPKDRAAIAEDIETLRRAARMLTVYADELTVAMEGGVSDESLQQLLDGAL